MSKIESLDQVKSVNIDFPFAQKNDYRPDGNLATSFITIKEEIDRAVVLGFNAISFDTNVPINPLTGELMLWVEDKFVGNSDKSFSGEVWKGIEYAEALGLRTIIDLNIRNAYNDADITTSSVGANFDFNKFFVAVTNFEVDLANKAQQYGVDGFQIGSFNFGTSDAGYLANWSSLVNSIKAVYKGTLRYSSNLEDLNNPLWKLVDEIQLNITPVFSLKDTYTAQDISNMYLSSYTMGNGQVSTVSVNDRLSEFIKLYQGKKISLEVAFRAGESAGHESADPWSYVYEFAIDSNNAKDVNTLREYPDAWIDYNLNSQKIAGFLEYFGNYLKGSISGIQYWQYAPWTESNWIRSPISLESKVWQSVQRAGPSLNWNPAAEEMLQTYLTKGWGFHYINYGTSSHDVLSGSSFNDRFIATQGGDVIDGGLGVDEIEYSTFKRSISKTSHGYMVGSDEIMNMERIRFTDVSVALDISGHAGTTAKLLSAVFGKNAIQNKQYVGIGIDLLDKGMSYDTLAALALGAARANTNDQIVTTLWTNVVGAAPSTVDKAPFIKMLEDGMAPGTLARIAADTSINTTNINLVGLAQTGIEYTPVV